MPTHSISKTCNDGTGSIGRSVVLTADGLVSLEITVPVSTANQLIAITTDQSQLKSFFMIADNICSVFQNDLSSGAPDKTIVLAKNQPFEWNYLSGAANPFGATDTTELYVTNPSSTLVVTLQIKQLADATP